MDCPNNCVAGYVYQWKRDGRGILIASDMLCPVCGGSMRVPDAQTETGNAAILVQETKTEQLYDDTWIDEIPF